MMSPYLFIKRALAIIAVIIGALYFTRPFLVPPSFGQYGQYRGAHLEEERARTPVYRGARVCRECHRENFKLKAAGRHARVPCEACHFQPYAGNDEREDAHPEISNAPDTSRDACRICHEYTPSRPKGFPQVGDFDKHISDNRNKVSGKKPGDSQSGALCVSCHNPHSPKIDMNGSGRS